MLNIYYDGDDDDNDSDDSGDDEKGESRNLSEGNLEHLATSAS